METHAVADGIPKALAVPRIHPNDFPCHGDRAPWGTEGNIQHDAGRKRLVETKHETSATQIADPPAKGCRNRPLRLTQNREVDGQPDSITPLPALGEE